MWWWERSEQHSTLLCETLWSVLTLPTHRTKPLSLELSFLLFLVALWDVLPESIPLLKFKIIWLFANNSVYPPALSFSLFFFSIFFPLSYCSGLAVGIYTTNSPEACHYVAENCSANILVVENHTQLQKILQVSGVVGWEEAVRPAGGCGRVNLPVGCAGSGSRCELIKPTWCVPCLIRMSDHWC